MNKQLRKKLQDYDRKVLEHDRKIVGLVWRMFHGEDVGREIGEAEAKKAEYVAQAGYQKLVEGALKTETNKTDQRELQVRRNTFLIESIKTRPEVQEALQKAGQAQYEFRVMVDGKPLDEGEVGKVLNDCPDREMREKVWRAQEQSLALAPLKLELVRALNRAARASGFDTYASAMLETQDSTEAEVLQQAAHLTLSMEHSRTSMFEAVCSLFNLPKLEPWDSQFYVSRYLERIGSGLFPADPEKAMQLFRKTLEYLGNGDEPFLGFHPDFLDRPPFMFSITGGEGYAPDQCAISIAPGARDYRVFINPSLSPNGLELTRTVMLETGRTVHYWAMDNMKTRTAFKWDNDCVRHAIAMFFDSMVEDKGWLVVVAGLPIGDAEVLSDALKMKKALMATGKASAALFETRLYMVEENPEALYAESQSSNPLLVGHDLGKRWAWNPDLAFNPGGQASYLLGYAISQKLSAQFDLLGMEEAPPPDHVESTLRLIRSMMGGYEKPWQSRLEGAHLPGQRSP